MDEKENTLCQYILAKDALKRKVAEHLGRVLIA